MVTALSGCKSSGNWFARQVVSVQPKKANKCLRCNKARVLQRNLSAWDTPCCTSL